MAWITTTDVRAALGLDPADTTDDAWLALVTAGANQQCYRWRLAWGYADNPDVVPTDHAVQLGTINYAVRRYHERGTGGSFGGALEGAVLPSIRAIWSDLGGPRPRVDYTAELTDDETDATLTAPPYGIAVWRFDAVTVAEDPGASEFRVTGTDPYVLVYSDTDENGNDQSALFAAVAAGDRLVVQRVGNALTYAVATVGAPTDNAGWWEVPVTDIIQPVALEAADDYVHIWRHVE